MPARGLRIVFEPAERPDLDVADRGVDTPGADHGGKGAYPSMLPVVPAQRTLLPVVRRGSAVTATAAAATAATATAVTDTAVMNTAVTYTAVTATAATEPVPSAAVLMARIAPTAEDRRWTTQALCAEGDPDRLFVTGAAQREAAKLCRNCPVQMECLADALDNRVEFGVWGGVTERQRRALLKRRPEVTSWRAVLAQARDDARRGVAS